MVGSCGGSSVGRAGQHPPSKGFSSSLGLFLLPAGVLSTDLLGSITINKYRSKELKR